MMKDLFDVVIVGGGASGLTAGIMAARSGASVLILEHLSQAGKKILATGNGKCNYTNRYLDDQCYRGEDPAFAKKVISRFSVEETIEFFERLGIYPKERDGYFYPNSEQAASVVSALLIESRRLLVSIYNQSHVTMISPLHKHKAGFELSYRQSGSPAAMKVLGRSVILACGGCASKVHGSDGSGYGLAKSFGHRIIPPLPALVQLFTDSSYKKGLAGVRAEGAILLCKGGSVLAKEQGELLFTDYGISGIPILQVSRFASQALSCGNQVSLYIDFFPKESREVLYAILCKRLSFGQHKTAEEIFIGLMNHKLAYVILKLCKIRAEGASSQIMGEKLDLLLGMLKEFKLTIAGTKPFESAQVTAGGVATDEVDDVCLESKLIEGLYVVGELLDIDGTCGGYNLQWAWSTGALAGRSAGSKYKGAMK